MIYPDKIQLNKIHSNKKLLMKDTYHQKYLKENQRIDQNNSKNQKHNLNI